MLQQHIHDYGFGLLVVADEAGIEANHLPFIFKSSVDVSAGVLQCHVARNNSVWQRLVDGARVLVVFQGPNAYISPSWYPSKAETGRAVPTWNYLAVHVQGRVRITHDGDWLRQHLQQLTDKHEAAMARPWALQDAPAEFIDGLIKAIVGIEIEIESLEGKLKASQNHPEQNRLGVKRGLQAAEPLGNGHDLSQLLSSAP